MHAMTDKHQGRETSAPLQHACRPNAQRTPASPRRRRAKPGGPARLFTPGFRAIVAAQAFSLLGAEILQFVLPLYLLNLTGSGTLYGAVVTAGFVPYTLLAPIGGVLADRTRKRGVMAALDALLACVMLGCLALAGSPVLVAATVAVLMVAFAAQALYQPCVQSAVPHVVSAEKIPAAMVVTNQVGMVTGIGGPVLGGMVFGFWGLAPIVALSAASFAASCALTLLFVRVPYDPPQRTAGLAATARADLAEALGFLRGRALMRRIMLAGMLVNMFGASLINVGTPYVVTEYLGLSNQLMGVAQGALAVGGLAGGALVALKPDRFGVRSMPAFLALAAACLGAVAAVLAAGLPPLASFCGMLACYVLTMVFCMVASIALMSYLQIKSPDVLVGKVMALSMMLLNLATPAGQLVYGVAFDHAVPWVIALVAAIVVAGVAGALRVALGRE